ncbi:hypothetical protein MKW92_053039 [Papaver armeniacum]|nr:hypothetical protein MKW92_053039 [Papaver armeniacum]
MHCIVDLSHSTTDAVLKKKILNFGQVVKVKIFTDESGKISKGFAFIQYTCQDDAVLLPNLTLRNCLLTSFWKPLIGIFGKLNLKIYFSFQYFDSSLHSMCSPLFPILEASFYKPFCMQAFKHLTQGTAQHIPRGVPCSLAQL